MPQTTLEPRMEHVETRVYDLEETLDRFIRANTEGMRELRKALQETDAKLTADSERLRAALEETARKLKADSERLREEMRANEAKLLADSERLREELREFKDEMLGFKDELREFKNELRKHQRKAEADRKAMNRKWGNLANKMGTLVEDIFAPSTPALARKYFGCGLEEDFSVRRARTMPGRPDRRREFDIVLACAEQVVLVEVKPSFRDAEVRRFRDFVESGEFFDYFPEYRGRRLVPVFATLYLTPAQVALLSRLGLYAMGAGDELADILNPELQLP